MARLDLQRAPGKYQKASSKKYVRGYDVNGRTPWGSPLAASDVAATGATGAVNGAWTPAGATAPESPAALIAGVPTRVTASPGTAWTTGWYVQTRTASTPGRAYWNGTAWVQGTAP